MESEGDLGDVRGQLCVCLRYVGRWTIIGPLVEKIDRLALGRAGQAII